LKNYRIELDQERSILNSEDAQARAATHVAASAFHTAKVLQASLQSTLNQVKGQIAVYVADAAAAAAAKSSGALKTLNLPPASLLPARFARQHRHNARLSYIGTWYCWGGSSRRCVDCSGLIMLATRPLASTSRTTPAPVRDTERVPLYDIEPGDLLFYGYNGDEHVAMYVVTAT